MKNMYEQYNPMYGDYIYIYIFDIYIYMYVIVINVDPLMHLPLVLWSVHSRSAEDSENVHDRSSLKCGHWQIFSDERNPEWANLVHDLWVHDLILKVWIQARLLLVELGLRKLWVATTPVTNKNAMFENPKALEQFANSTSLQLWVQIYINLSYIHLS